MTDGSPQRVLVVFEFPPSDAEWQTRDLVAALQARRPNWSFQICAGFQQKYRPGGLRPWRLLSGVWLHVRAFMQITLGRPGLVIVRSAPPLIQMTVAAACRLRRAPYWVWLMDAHPEIEAVLWARIPLLAGFCRFLARRNARALAAAERVIVLDEGMRRRLVPTLDRTRVVICPTWGSSRFGNLAPAPTPGAADPGRLRFAYLGNLGLAHDVPLMASLLRALAEKTKVDVTCIGTSPEAVADLGAAVADDRVTIAHGPPIPFDQLPAELPKRKFDYGLITLAESFLGLLSPSKFSGYLVGGLPIVYLGPEGANAALVCDQLGAGLRIDRDALSGPRRSAVLERLVSPDFRAQARTQVPGALAFFERFDGEYLATELLTPARPIAA